MKYIQLTKEQLEALHQEFATFLATQQIDVKEWNDIKQNKPAVAEEEINIFSDLVWEDVLTNTLYVEHFSKNSINLFKTNQDNIQRILIKIEEESIDLTTAEGFSWLMLNATNPVMVSLYKGTKNYTSERNVEIFDLILKGGQISKEGQLYQQFAAIV